MSDARMPPGRYLSALLDLGTDLGGQTRASLMRNRLFAERFGLQPEILTFSARPAWGPRLEDLRERGLLAPGIAVHNLLDAAATGGWEADPVAPHPGPPLVQPDMERRTELRPDGSPWRHVHTSPDGRTVVNEYLRDDGSPYLRVPRFAYRFRHTWPTTLERVGRDGEPRGAFDSYGALVRRWVVSLVEGDTYLFLDSQSLGMHLLPVRARGLHTVVVGHRVHVRPPYRWNSPLVRESRAVLRQLSSVDALVSQTHRQRDDLARRFGEAPQLVVAPNAVTPALDPPDVAREPQRLVTVCRLVPGKRLEDALAVVDLLRARVPGVRLDMYGEGPERPALEAELARRGLHDHVTLHGHDPLAKDQLWSATAMLMTSESETWSLSVQEAMNHGCPVVSYDIKYGPREQITDGVDGRLVPLGDVAAMAEAAHDLLRDPDLVARMGRAARTAASDSVRRFDEDWTEVLGTARQVRRSRPRVRRVVARPARLGLRRNRWGRSRPVDGPRLAVRPDGRGRVDLDVRAEVYTDQVGELNEARWELLVIDPEGEEHVALKPRVERDGQDFRIRADFPESLPGAHLRGATAHLRLGLVWRSLTWTHWLTVADAAGEAARAELLLER